MLSAKFDCIIEEPLPFVGGLPCVVSKVFTGYSCACLQGEPLPYGFHGVVSAKMLGEKAEVVKLLLAVDYHEPRRGLSRR